MDWAVIIITSYVVARALTSLQNSVFSLPSVISDIGLSVSLLLAMVCNDKDNVNDKLPIENWHYNAPFQA